MAPESHALLSLAESVADGATVDWEAAEGDAGPDERLVVRQLRVLSHLAVLHRTLPAEPDQSQPAVAVRPLGTPAIGRWGGLALIERLGRGSFGEVYRAWDGRLEREIALKLLRMDAADAAPRASRISHEGRLLAKVRHPNVITVHGVDVHDGRIGLWMELVRGATLEQILGARGPFGAHEAASIGVDLCRALAAIHAAGLIHRDVKAQNVMREEGGRIVLMDLGTGREVRADATSGAGEIAGTPLCLAPELFGGAAASVRSDIYSLGVLLYHLVTGAYPVPATTIETLRTAHERGETVRLRDLRPDLPTAFVRVVDRAIATDPDQRYATAGALEADLLRVLEAASTPTPSGFLSRHGAWTWRAAAAIVCALATAALAWTAFRPAAASVHSLAVLPLVNLSGDAAQDYFADGVTDELISMLGRLEGLNVISRTSVVRFKASGKGLQEIAAALGADRVLEGSVQIVGAAASSAPRTVRINARLIHAGTDTQLWNRTFETVAADMATLQKEIAQAVADGIRLRLTSRDRGVLEERPRRAVGPQDFTAFDLYLRGRYYWNMRTREGLSRSVQYFREATERSPTYAAAYAGLADAYTMMGAYGVLKPTEANQLASENALRALALDDSLAEAHASLGVIRNRRFEWTAAESSFTRALQLRPGYATAHHWYAIQLVQHGRFDEALEHIETCVKLDPLSVTAQSTVGIVHLLARRYDEAVIKLEAAARMDPQVARVRQVLAQAYVQKGLFDRALGEAQAAERLEPGDVALQADIGYILAVAGRRTEAVKVAQDLAGRYPAEEDAAFSAAIVYAGLQDATNAFLWLDRARERRDPALADAKVDLRLDRLRGDPRFDTVLTSVGLVR